MSLSHGSSAYLGNIRIICKCKKRNLQLLMLIQCDEIDKNVRICFYLFFFFEDATLSLLIWGTSEHVLKHPFLHKLYSEFQTVEVFMELEFGLHLLNCH